MIKTPNGIFEIDLDDCYIRNHMMSGKVFEHHIINGRIKKYVEKSKYIVDVGANIGCHTISYASFSPESKIWAFEPQKKLCEILKRNVSVNNYSKRIEVFNKGLGHKKMNTQLRPVDAVRDENNNGWNKAGLGIGKDGENIEIITLDSLNLPGLDYMKIDVEGAEGLVISGAEETIKKYKPVIFFEHNYQKIDPEDVGMDYVPTPFEVLVKLGYKTFLYVDWDNYLAFPDDLVKETETDEHKIQ